MRFILYLLPMLLSSCIISPEIRGSGKLTEYNQSLDSFTKIVVDSSVQLNIKYDPDYSITVICDDNIPSYINIVRKGETAFLSLTEEVRVIDATVKINISMPFLTELTALDGNVIQVSGFDIPEQLIMRIQGNSKGSVYLTDCESMAIEISQNSMLDISSVYTVESLSINLSGNSSSNMEGLSCISAKIDISEGSALRLNMEGSVIGQLSGGSTLFYRGIKKPGPLLFSDASGIVYY